MTPIRETIARAIYDDANPSYRHDGYGEVMPCWAAARRERKSSYRKSADAVLRALDEAGLVVVPREATEAMQVAGVEAMGTAERAAQTRADALLVPRNDFQRGAAAGGVMACNSVNLDAAYRAMIAAAPDAG